MWHLKIKKTAVLLFGSLLPYLPLLSNATLPQVPAGSRTVCPCAFAGSPVPPRFGFALSSIPNGRSSHPRASRNARLTFSLRPSVSPASCPSPFPSRTITGSSVRAISLALFRLKKAFYPFFLAKDCPFFTFLKNIRYPSKFSQPVVAEKLSVLLVIENFRNKFTDAY